MTRVKAEVLKGKPNYTAPDGSEIRLLVDMNGGGLAHCTLPCQKTSLAVKHKKVEKIWFFTQGHGQVWRKLADYENVRDIYPGVCLTIPPDTHFQFRNLGPEPLCFLIATMPPWPGPEEVVRVDDHWTTC